MIWSYTWACIAIRFPNKQTTPTSANKEVSRSIHTSINKRNHSEITETQAFGATGVAAQERTNCESRQKMLNMLSHEAPINWLEDQDAPKLQSSMQSLYHAVPMQETGARHQNDPSTGLLEVGTRGWGGRGRSGCSQLQKQYTAQWRGGTRPSSMENKSSGGWTRAGRESGGVRTEEGEDTPSSTAIVLLDLVVDLRHRTTSCLNTMQHPIDPDESWQS